MYTYDRVVSLFLENMFPDLDPTNKAVRALWDHNPVKPVAKEEEVLERVQMAIYRVMDLLPMANVLIQKNMSLHFNHPCIGSAAVDQSGHLIFNTDFVSKITDSQLTFVVLHEALHIIKEDLFEGPRILGPKPTQVEHNRMNIAMDLVNNWDIGNIFSANQNVDSIPGACYPDEDGILRKISSSEIGGIIELDKDLWIEISGGKTQVDIYYELQKLDDELIKALAKNVFDTHIFKPTLTVDDVETIIERVRKKPGPPKPPGGGKKNVVGEILQGLIVKDRYTGQWAIIVNEPKNEDTEAVIMPISNDDYEDIVRVSGGKRPNIHPDEQMGSIVAPRVQKHIHKVLDIQQRMVIGKKDFEPEV